jgi:hypothetical protein
MEDDETVNGKNGVCRDVETRSTQDSVENHETR